MLTTQCTVKLIDIDIQKPDWQTLRAALELIADDFIIVFPSENGPALLCRFSAANQKRMTDLLPGVELRLTVAEDSDENAPSSVGLPLFRPDHTRNRAFHTLVQLCDFPLLVAEGVGDHSGVEYGFRAL